VSGQVCIIETNGKVAANRKLEECVMFIFFLQYILGLARFGKVQNRDKARLYCSFCIEWGSLLVGDK